jgi:hypothetical protein
MNEASLNPIIGTTVSPVVAGATATAVKLILPQRSSTSAGGAAGQPALLAELQPRIAAIKYPVTSQAELLSSLGTSGKLMLQNRMVDLTTATANLPKSFFPIASAEDFSAKVAEILKSQSVLPPIVQINHPTSATKQSKS